MTQKIAYADDHFHDECGVFGVFGHPEASNLTYLGLYALQHRGQESAGIVSSAGGELHAHAAKIQCQGNRRPGLKQGKFRRAADIDFASAGESHAGLAGVDGDYAAIHNEHARRARRSSVCCCGAAFDRNVIAFDAANCAGRRLLSLRGRQPRNETSEQQEKQRQAPASE
jgi:hypothetical protein